MFYQERENLEYAGLQRDRALPPAQFVAVQSELKRPKGKALNLVAW